MKALDYSLLHVDGLVLADTAEAANIISVCASGF